LGKKTTHTRQQLLVQLVTRAKNLYVVVSRDSENQRWTSWQKYLERYNQLWRDAIEILPELASAPLATVPKYNQGGPSSPSLKEQDKLTEIQSAAHSLLLELQQRVKPPDINRTKRMTRSQAFESIDRICNGFHRIAQELASGSPDCARFCITEERDVQKLLYAILMLEFDDVRREEPTGSDVGGSGRMDFLIMPHGIGLEVKLAREDFSSGELGGKLIEVSDRYRQHKKCHALFCFVYDPCGRIKSPRGFERDLESKSDRGFTIRAAVRPRH